MTTERLSLRIDAELEKGLERKARREERSASYLAVRAIEAMLHSRAEKRAAIRAAIAEADRGAFVSQAAMDTWISSWDFVLGFRLGASASGTGYVLDCEVRTASRPFST